MVPRPGGGPVIAPRTFRAFLGTSFRKNLAYRTEVWLSIALGLVVILIQAAIWRSLLRDGAVEGITVEDMVTYVIISTVVSTISMHRMMDEVDARLHSGDIAIDLIKPMPYAALQFADQLGRAAVQIVSVVLPMVGVALFLLDTRSPDGVIATLGFVAAVAIQMVVSFAMALVLALLAFWFLTTFHFRWANGALFSLFGGTFLPLWFVPDWFEAIARLLPYQFAAFVPAAVYLGQIAGGDLLRTLALGAFWVVALLAGAHQLWTAAVRRLTLQGG